MTSTSRPISKEVKVALNPDQAVNLARALRELRESTWPDQELTQGPTRESAQRGRPGGGGNAELMGVDDHP